MKKFLHVVLCLSLCSSLVYTQSYWKLPADKVPLQNWTILFGHNAFSNIEKGWLYAQQYWSIEHQLKYGVRGLMLDTYEYEYSGFWDKPLKEIGKFFKKAGQAIAGVFTKQQELEIVPDLLLQYLASNKPKLTQVDFDSLLSSIRTYMQDIKAGKKSKQTLYLEAQEIISMLDMKATKKSDAVIPKGGNRVALCHVSCDLSSSTLRPLQKTMRLCDTLKVVREFLKNNPNEVVIILLENYVTNVNVLKDAFKDVWSIMLKPVDWNPEVKKGWPTYGWLRKNNKRLIVFCDHHAVPDIMYSTWPNVIENQFSTVDIKQAATERAESRSYRNRKRYLYCFNWFKKVSDLTGYPGINENKLREAVAYAIKNGLDGHYKGMYPTIVALDYVNLGNPIKYINELNQQRLTAKV